MRMLRGILILLITSFCVLALGGYMGTPPIWEAVNVPPPQHINRVDEIAAGCQKAFGADGPDAVMQCKTEIMVREALQRQDEKMQRAAE